MFDRDETHFYLKKVLLFSETSLTHLIFERKSAACKSKLLASASDRYQYNK